jgi:hypothetical protein
MCMTEYLVCGMEARAIPLRLPSIWYTNIDGDDSISATVTGHMFRDAYASVECSWFVNGNLTTLWIDDWRLSHA